MNKQEILEEIKKYSVPELCDGMEYFCTMDADIKPMAGGTKMVGTAFTIDIPAGEGGFVAEALKDARPGEIIVIAGKGNTKSSYWGDHRSLCASMLGAAGVVVDGAFRDVEECEAIDLPIFAKAITPGTALKTRKGQKQVPVCCGGVNVQPGDIVVGDRNGVCVFSFEDAEEIIRKTKDKIKRQEFTIQEMKRTGTVITQVL